MHNWSDLTAVEPISNAATAKSLQSCPTLCNPIDSSPPGSPVPVIFQARTLEWVAISFSNAWKWKVKVKSLSCVWLLGTPWTAAYQAPPSMGFSRQEYWSGMPLPSPISNASTINIYLSWYSGLYCGVMLQCSTKRKNQAAAHTSFSSKNKGEVRTLNWTGIDIE